MAILPILAPSFTNMAFTVGTQSALGSFFSQIFLNPGDHFYTIAIMAGVTIAGCVGVAFLVKMAYDKYCPEKILT